MLSGRSIRHAEYMAFNSPGIAPNTGEAKNPNPAAMVPHIVPKTMSPRWLSFIRADSYSLAAFISSSTIVNSGDSGVIVGFRAICSTLLLNAVSKS